MSDSIHNLLVRAAQENEEKDYMAALVILIDHEGGGCTMGKLTRSELVQSIAGLSVVNNPIECPCIECEESRSILKEVADLVHSRAHKIIEGQKPSNPEHMN